MFNVNPKQNFLESITDLTNTWLHSSLHIENRERKRQSRHTRASPVMPGGPLGDLSLLGLVSLKRDQYSMGWTLGNVPFHWAVPESWAIPMDMPVLRRRAMAPQHFVTLEGRIQQGITSLAKPCSGSLQPGFKIIKNKLLYWHRSLFLHTRCAVGSSLICSAPP